MVEPYPNEFHDDVEMGRATHSMGLIGSICTELLDSMPISYPCLPILPSPLRAFHKSLGDIRRPHPLFDSYCTYLEDVPRKITWSTFFARAFDFSIVFDEFKRALTLFAPFLLVLYYSHHSEMNAQAHDKLL